MVTHRHTHTYIHIYIYIYIYIYINVSSWAKWAQCLPMSQETGVQSQVESYQRLKKWYVIPPCITLSTIRYVSRKTWSNPGKGAVPSPIPQCSYYWKGYLWVTLDYGQQLYFLCIHMYVCMYVYSRHILLNMTDLELSFWFVFSCLWLRMLQMKVKSV